MTPFTYKTSTSGEILYLFLRTLLRKGASLDDAFYWLSPIDTAAEWSEYIEQFIAVALNGQIIAYSRP